MSYVSKDRARLERAVISPMTAYSILKEIDPARIRRVFQNAPDEIREQVNGEVLELIVAAQIHLERISAQPADVRPSVTSGERLDAWMTVAEVAQMLGKTDRTVRRYIESGDLVARLRDKKSYVVDRSSAELLATNKTGAGNMAA